MIFYLHLMKVFKDILSLTILYTMNIMQLVWPPLMFLMDFYIKYLIFFYRNVKMTII